MTTPQQTLNTKVSNVMAVWQQVTKSHRQANSNIQQTS